jgi:hypothetical protein
MEEGGLCERLVRFTKIDIKIKTYLDAWNSEHESASYATEHYLSLSRHYYVDARMNETTRPLCPR